MDSQPQKLSGSSADSISSAFNHFSVPPTQTSVSRGKYEEVQPSAGGSKFGTVEFVINPGDGIYTDLANSFLQLNVRVVNATGDPLSATLGDVNVWAGDNFAHSLFEKVTVRLNDRDIEYHGNYNYWAYLSNRLNYDSETQKTSLLASSGWFADDDVARDANELTDPSIARRKRLVSASKALSFSTRLRLAFFSSDLYVFPGSKVTVALNRAAPAFALGAIDNTPVGGARIEITSATFHALRLKVNASLLNAQVERALKGDRIRYPVRRVKDRTTMLVRGERSATFVLPSTKQCPSRCLVFFVNSEAAGGNYALNPYKFGNYDVTHLDCKVEGLGETIEYKTNFATGEGLSLPYSQLMKLVGRFENDRPFSVSFEEWRTRSTIWAFDLSEDKNRDGSTLQLIKSGRLTFSARFANPLPHNVTVFFVTEQDDIIETGLDNAISTLVPVL